MEQIQILNNGDPLYDIRRKINENFRLTHEKIGNISSEAVRFTVNSGNETLGVADLLIREGSTLTFKVGGEYPNLVVTSGKGNTQEITSLNPLYMAGLSTGTYVIVVDGPNTQVVANNKFHYQLLEPTEVEEGDIWFNGEGAYQYITIEENTGWVDYNFVPIGEVLFRTNAIASSTTYPYNRNGLVVATTSTFGMLRMAADSDEIDCSCNDAVLTPANLYDLNNYRRVNTEYNVDDKVGCPYHHNLQLKCTQAGTTSNEALNTKGYLEPGTTIEDGSVIWEVEELGTGSSGNSGFNLFDTKISDHVLEGEAAEGWALQGTYVYKEAIASSRYGYPDFYNKVLEEYNEATNTETVNNVTVKVHANGHKFYNIADKDAIDNFFNTMGLAWFYGLDTENERVFLPRNNWFEQATTDESEVGNFVEAGLPNITGSISINTGSGIGSANGAFSSYGGGNWIGGGANTAARGANFDASLSSSIYGKSDTVQPNAVKKLLYICVGNTESVSSVTNVVDVTTTENDTTPLFTGMYFDFTPNNVSWLKAGRTVDGADIYAFVYNELVNILNGETKYGELKVIDKADMIAGIDYSLYWKVNQDDMTFTTPTAISNKALSGAVVGNGMTLGLTDGTTNYGLSYGNNYGAVIYTGTYGDELGIETDIGNTPTHSARIGITSDPTKSGIIAEQSTSQLYFKVANAVQNLELLDVGKVMENAVLRSSLVEAQVVIETYVNGTSWYRVWSDGFCQQGYTGKATGSATTVKFLKPFKDTSYTLLAQNHRNSTSAWSNRFGYDKTTTGFTWNGDSGVVQDWYACGYIW